MYYSGQMMYSVRCDMKKRNVENEPSNESEVIMEDEMVDIIMQMRRSMRIPDSEDNEDVDCVYIETYCIA